MSNLVDDMNVAVRRLVREALGLGENDVRPAGQDAAAGAQGAPFATVKLISVQGLGSTPAVVYDHEDPEDRETDLVEATMQPLRVVASVQFFGAAARAAALRGGLVSASLAALQAVTAGGFDVTIDGTLRQVSGLNFSGAADLDAVAALVQARVVAAGAAGATVVWTGKRFILTSPATGQTSAVSAASAPTAGGAPSDASTLLALTAAAGAVPADNKTGIARHGNDAYERARRLPLLLETSAMVALMRQMQLGYEQASQVRDLSALSTDRTWESRGSVDLTFTVIARETAVVDTLETVPEAGLLLQRPGEDIHTIEIEVSP